MDNEFGQSTRLTQEQVKRIIDSAADRHKRTIALFKMVQKDELETVTIKRFIKRNNERKVQ